MQSDIKSVIKLDTVPQQLFKDRPKRARRSRRSLSSSRLFRRLVRRSDSEWLKPGKTPVTPGVAEVCGGTVGVAGGGGKPFACRM